MFNSIFNFIGLRGGDFNPSQMCTTSASRDIDSTPRDVIAFLWQRREWKAETGKREFPPLEEIEQQLGRGELIPVLKAIWNAEDRGRVRQWLRDQENTLHAIILAELAVAELSDNPTEETLIHVSLPLLNAGMFRGEQDSCCIMDSSLNKNIPFWLNNVYLDALDEIISSANSSLNIATIQQFKRIEVENAIDKKMMEVAEKTLNSPLPSPE